MFSCMEYIEFLFLLNYLSTAKEKKLFFFYSTFVNIKIIIYWFFFLTMMLIESRVMTGLIIYDSRPDFKSYG